MAEDVVELATEETEAIELAREDAAECIVDRSR
jgi:hypothetical protein